MKVSKRESSGASGLSWARTKTARAEELRTKDITKGRWTENQVSASRVSVFACELI
jgi:hypothetical protein